MMHLKHIWYSIYDTIDVRTYDKIYYLKCLYWHVYTFNWHYNNKITVFCLLWINREVPAPLCQPSTAVDLWRLKSGPDPLPDPGQVWPLPDLHTGQYCGSTACLYYHLFFCRIHNCNILGTRRICELMFYLLWQMRLLPLLLRQISNWPGQGRANHNSVSTFTF